MGDGDGDEAKSGSEAGGGDDDGTGDEGIGDMDGDALATALALVVLNTGRRPIPHTQWVRAIGAAPAGHGRHARPSEDTSVEAHSVQTKTVMF